MATSPLISDGYLLWRIDRSLKNDLLKSPKNLYICTLVSRVSSDSVFKGGATARVHNSIDPDVSSEDEPVNN
jgi:hypothetical protein